MIIFYDLNGNVVERSPLIPENLKKIHGTMIRCSLKAESIVHEGFADVYRQFESSTYTLTIGDYIHVWTWDNFDEDNHRLCGEGQEKYSQTYTPIKIIDIARIDAILYSNPRWGTALRNTFWVQTVE